MKELSRLLQNTEACRWRKIDILNDCNVLSFDKRKIKGKQYARPFVVGIGLITKKEIYKRFKMYKNKSICREK